MKHVRHEMAIAMYAPGIQYLKGALAKPKKKDGHNHGDYLIGTHREAATTNPNCTRIYVRKGDSYVRTTPPTTDELWARTRFAEVAAAVAARKKDLSKINADKAAFLAQKNEPGGLKTMTAYLWSLEKAAYDQAHPRA